MISTRYECNQNGGAFLGATGMREGMSHQDGAQGNVGIRSHRDTCISDASGVQPEAPKGVRRTEFAGQAPGESSPEKKASGSLRGD